MSGIARSRHWVVSSSAALGEFCGGLGVEAALNLGNGAGIAGKA